MLRSLFSSLAVALALSACSTIPAHAQSVEASPLGVQIVQSVPAETDLAVPGLPQAQQTWIQMIRGAKSTIDLGQFYVANQSGQALEPVLQELEAAGARGVKIRIILSNSMLGQDQPAYQRLQAIKNAEVRILDLSKLTGGIIHAKYWVVDGRDIFVGSQNLDWRALSQIHELGVRFTDPQIASQLTSIFDLDWSFIRSGAYPQAPVPPPADPAKLIELVASPQQMNPAGIRSSIQALVELINSARKTLQIQVMDYSPVAGKEFWPEIDNALRAASVRGVKIQFLVANWSTEEPTISHLKSLSLVPRIELRIATIPQASTGFIPYARVVHSKYMMVDDSVFWLGTSNWSKGYFYATRGVELIFRNADLTRQAQDVFLKVWNSPYSEKIDANKTYPAPVKG